jgi:tRNA dimethylallyltransferase
MSAPFFLTGPTASGKSAVAVLLAERLGGEIVNADAFQLYQGMDLLTAKPGPADLARVPHHLYSVLPADERCDAQRYRELALPVLADIAARGRLPIVVGGSGLYVKALSHGLAELAGWTLEAKTARLLELDPHAAGNVPLANPRYVERALEICLLTGQPQSQLRQTFAKADPLGHGVTLDVPRAELHERIHRRLQAMLAEGLLDEVRALPEIGATAARAIGLRELRAHLAGELSLEAALEAMETATRRYAKRQLTWFRRETWLQSICLPAGATAECALDLILPHVPCPPNPPPPSTST